MKKYIHTLYFSIVILVLVSVSVQVVTAQTYSRFDTNLGTGSRGNLVLNLQNTLIQKGFLGASYATGYFGNITKNALRAYQNAFLIPATGFFGPITRAHLNKDIPLVIGGDRDSHGCVTGGGYVWDAELQKCARSWEKLTSLFANNKWYLVQADGTTSSQVYFNIENNRIAGKACNFFSGSVLIQNADSSITVSNIVSTLMACMDPVISNNESDLFSLLQGKVSVLLRTDGTLELSANGKKMIFTKQVSATLPVDTAERKCVAQGGSWSAMFNECNGISGMACSAAGGVFNECASPCRHNPSAQVCIAMCAQVCTIVK